ncbi:MAG: hypothetical protein RBT61_06825 [Candidatus Kapabacteria bacterium]|jgi:hypothetical protein|nr:hypothetical protein [Candidatus Kapabacteria bacterium]
MNIFSRSKYCILLLSLVLIAGCENITSPVTEQYTTVKSISKWLVDTLSGNRLTCILYKKFDKNGYLLLQEDFSNNGDIVSQSVYEHESGKSLEVKISFTETGELKSENKVEYEYDSGRRIIKQINYDNSGNVRNIYTFEYDNFGNVISRNQTFGPSEAGTNYNVDYNYSSSGDLLERVTVLDNGNLSRDSIAYDSDKHKVVVYSFDSLGELSSKIIYTYNNQGSIIAELHFDAAGYIKNSYIYEYEFFKN